MRDAWQRKMSHESQYRTSAREAKAMREYNANTILDSMPDGYRWANEWEAEHSLTFWNEMVQVRVNPNDPDETDFAIRSDVYETGN